MSNAFIAICICIIIVLLIAMVVILLVVARRAMKRRRRLTEISYTEIVQSLGGSTTFMVQYVSGDRELITVRENSRMCREYLNKLRMKDEER